MACEGSEPRGFECSNPAQVQELRGVHYEDADCDAATRIAESRLTTAYYRKACEQRSPSEGVPANVSDAYVSRCEPATGDVGGSILLIQLCCP
jgi:hypothetical protein